MNFKIIKIFTFFKVFVCLLLTVVECFPRLDGYDIWADFNQSRQFADRFVNDSNNIPLNSSENYDRFPRGKSK